MGMAEHRKYRHLPGEIHGIVAPGALGDMGGIKGNNGVQFGTAKRNGFRLRGVARPIKTYKHSPSIAHFSGEMVKKAAAVLTNTTAIPYVPPLHPARV